MTDDLAAVRYAHRVGLLAAKNFDAVRLESFCFTGEGPFLTDDLVALLPEGVPVADDPEAASILVIGLYDYSEEVIRAATEVDDMPRIIPQEALIDLVLFGYDWWVTAIGQLNHAADYQPGMRFAKSLADTGAFVWPNTEIERSEETPEEVDLDDLRSTSNLFDTGYRITGLSRQQRWSVLTRSSIPSLGLRAVAQTIAYNVRLRKLQRNGEDKYAYAIGEWQHDLARLHDEVYLPGRGFPWPSPDR